MARQVGCSSVSGGSKTKRSLVKPWKKNFNLPKINSGKLSGDSGEQSGALLTVFSGGGVLVTSTEVIVRVVEGILPGPLQSHAHAFCRGRVWG